MERSELISIRLDLIKRHFHPNHVPTLVAVTKKQPVSDIEFAYRAGVRDFGENRVEELVEKAKECERLGLDDICWHFIGQIQSKKIPKLLSVKNLVAIHSIDSHITLQNLMKRQDDFKGQNLHLFLQVNTSNEKEKSGFIEWDELAAAINLLLNNEGQAFELFGLMTMSKLRTNNFEEDALKCFNQLKKIKFSLIKDFHLQDLKLSMGMSNDFEVALQAGTDYLRLGSSIFAPDQRDAE
jgi:pyridoxal phosphate enzyme (YggS family)